MKLKSFTNKDRHGNMTSFEFYEGSDVDMGPIPPMMEGVPDHPGDPKGTDTVPAWLTPGEFVMNTEATRIFEPQIEQMNNVGRAIQAQQGGTIPEYAAHGGPVYMNQGGSWLDSLLGMFSGSRPDASNRGFPTNNTRFKTLNDIPKSPTRPDPLMSNKIYMDLLKDKEGFRNEAYLDSAGVPTIGYGFTKGVKMGDTMTEEEANARLLEEMAVTDRDYNNLVTADLNSNQEAAVKSLLYNIGGPQFANSKARAALNSGDFETFQKEAAEFRMADGKVVPGLENRRRDEIELFNTPPRTAKEIFNERIPALQGKVNERTAAEEFSGTGTAPRTAQEIFDERIPALRDKIDERNLSIPDELSGPEMGRGRTAQEVFDSRVPALQSRVNDRTAAEEFSGTGTAPRTAEEIFNERIPALQSKVAEGNLSIPDELSGPEMGRRRTRKEIFDSRVPALQNMANPEADEMLQASEFEGLGGVPPMDDTPIDFSQYSDGPFGPRVPDAIGPRSEDQQIRDEVLLRKPEIKEPSSNMTVGELFSAASNIDPVTGEPKVDAGQDNTYRGVGIPQNRKEADALAEEVDSTALKAAQEKADKANSELEKATKELEAKQANGTATIDDVNSHKSLVEKANAANSDLEATVKSNEKGAANRKAASDEEANTVSSYDPKNPTVPKTGEPPKSDADEEGDSIKESKVFEVEEIINDNENTPDDNTVTGKRTPDEVEKKGGEAPPEDINKAKGFFQSILGDLFDEGELQRMAIMYVGGRMLGGSHNGSLNYAAKQYVKRVDSKASEHNKFVKSLIKDGTYKASSISKYKKTKNLSDLEKKDATYAPTGGVPVTKMVPQFNKKGDIIRYTKETLVPVKSSADKGTYYQTASGSVIHPSRFANLPDYRKELDGESEEYKQRRSRILGDMKSYFEEIRDGSPDNYTEEDGKRTYRVGVGPERAALFYYDWAKKQGVDPDSTAGRKVMTQAYENMVMEAKSEGIKFTPNDFTRYLEAQQLRETTGAPELFITNMDKVKDKKAVPEYVRADKMDLLYQNLDTVISKIPGSSTRRDDIIGIAIKKWNSLDKTDDGRALKKKYENSAEKSAGESGFYKYMMDTAQALHTEINKPKE